jgi:galactokinase
MLNLNILQTEFTKIFSVPPECIVRAPGRVNLIGEHTDYNDGFVLPIAIDRETRIAARRRADRIVRMVALDFGGAMSEMSLDAILRDDAQPWSNYIRGVALMLERRGVRLPGAEMVIHGNVPIGSGLSSSAALQVCAAMTFRTLGGFDLDGVTLAKICQKADNEFVGVQSGIMDQFIALLARADHALLIDCRDLSYASVPLPNGAKIIVCDTMKRRGLVDSEYNARRAECEQAVRLLGAKLGKPIRALRDVSWDEFTRLADALPATVARRARHVITENARVLEAVAAAQRGDLATFGALMDASHTSLRDDYAVSCPELEIMVEIARKQPGCLGARLTGAGFGGCTVNLVEEETAQAFVTNVAREYAKRTGRLPQIYPCRAMAGASELPTEV